MSNGIVSQLPSSHLSIHRVPAKLFYGVVAPRSKLLPATALVFHFDNYQPDRISRGADFSGCTATQPLSRWFFLMKLFCPTINGFLSRTLPSFRLSSSEARQGSGLFLYFFLSLYTAFTPSLLPGFPDI